MKILLALTAMFTLAALTANAQIYQVTPDHQGGYNINTLPGPGAPTLNPVPTFVQPLRGGGFQVWRPPNPIDEMNAESAAKAAKAQQEQLDEIQRNQDEILQNQEDQGGDD